jgi:hypothetical protein
MGMIDTMDMLHTGFDASEQHLCEPRIFAHCIRCGRRVVWCRMTTEEILLITARRFVCMDCGAGR